MRPVNRRRVIAALTLFGLTGACGGSNATPAAPTVVATPTPEGPSLTVFSGLNGLPVPGASVQSAGGAVATDASGRAVLPATSQAGGNLDINASGFFVRETTLKSGAERLYLWPRVLSSGASESYTARLVYTTTTDGAVEGATSLRRLVPGLSTAWVYLPPEIRTDRIAAALSAAIAEINSATQGQVVYQLTSSRPSGNQIVFDVAIDGTDSFCADRVIAFFRVTLVNSANVREIYGGLVNLCEAKWAEDTSVLTHELGHSLGLFHSSRSVDVMHPTAVGHGAFTGEERLAIYLGFQRRGGNRYPDSDRVTAASEATEAPEVIVCKP
jgi:hypothetical protein